MKKIFVSIFILFFAVMPAFGLSPVAPVTRSLLSPVALAKGDGEGSLAEGDAPATTAVDLPSVALAKGGDNVPVMAFGVTPGPDVAPAAADVGSAEMIDTHNYTANSDKTLKSPNNYTPDSHSRMKEYWAAYDADQDAKNAYWHAPAFWSIGGYSYPYYNYGYSYGVYPGRDHTHSHQSTGGRGQGRGKR